MAFEDDPTTESVTDEELKPQKISESYVRPGFTEGLARQPQRILISDKGCGYPNLLKEGTGYVRYHGDRQFKVGELLILCADERGELWAKFASIQPSTKPRGESTILVTEVCVKRRD